MEIFDLLDELVAQILEGKRYLFMDANHVVLKKDELIETIDVIRKMIDEKYKILKTKLVEDMDSSLVQEVSSLKNKKREEAYNENNEAKDIVMSAKQEAREIKEEIDEYADKILENLKLTVSKFKRKLLKLDTVIDLSRDRIQKTAYYADNEEENEDEE
ncbi:MAG: hypothetical protein A2Y40_07350 [Candidatus Margulisbacteria bacterium GWF2_35_9]|nr:MAG: hypothetical protein A2Y40_07350 [Candidatus Margulisbacteria bacterium GWF2_35_9]